MPCAEERRDCEKPLGMSSDGLDAIRIYDLNAKIIQLEAMLCALCTETDKSIQIRAEEEGACNNIAHWFYEHRREDIIKLTTHGLPDNPSRHELTLYNKIFS